MSDEKLHEMNYNALKETLKETEATWPERPGLAISLNIGTTMTGAIDQVTRINDVLSEIDWPQEKVLIHADAALLGRLTADLYNDQRDLQPCEDR